METIKLALDWTPNVNHVGFFVAKNHGLYREAGIELDISSPEDDNYALTPAKKVELGQADFTLCPMESVLSYQTKERAFDLKAVAAIYQEDLSAIACLKSNGIRSPRELDQKSYASYKARYEDAIVKQMIINDGGKGDLDISYPEKLGIWDTIVKGEFDATWIFTHWEGIQAEEKGLQLDLFKMLDYGVPYSYSPVIAASEKNILNRSGLFKKFLEVTKQGFLMSAAKPDDAAKVLEKLVSPFDADIDLKKAIDLSSEALGTESTWGTLDINNIQSYLAWIYARGLESKVLKAEDLILTL
ncbi:MAG: ABC transporter substrate-binding protein [Bacteroidota bacterium]